MSKDLNKQLKSIEKDVLNGLKNKSVDRLRNLITYNPDNLKLREQLAQLYFDSGFFDAAGMYWILTAPTTDEIILAQKTYLESVNNSGTQVLNDIKFRGDKSLLDEYAKNVLEKFEADSIEKSNYIPNFTPKSEGKFYKKSKR